MSCTAGNARCYKDSTLNATASADFDADADSDSATYNIFDRLAKADEGKVILGGDNIKTLINEARAARRVNRNVTGWRIRVFSDKNQNALQKAEATKASLAKIYGSAVYITHNSPNFYVEVGDYRTLDEAEKTRKRLSSTYPGAAIVQTRINFPPL
jgi:hypothetical protein